MMELNSKNVERIFLDCLFKSEELAACAPNDPVMVTARGVVTNVGFHPERLASHKEDLTTLVNQLPLKFKDGNSFLGMCDTREGRQWGEHRNMDQLVCLCLASGLMEQCNPPELNALMPGGVPYFRVIMA